MPRDVSEEIFDLFDRRKHNSAMILTSNRDIDEWPQAFPDPVLVEIDETSLVDLRETEQSDRTSTP